MRSFFHPQNSGSGRFGPVYLSCLRPMLLLAFAMAAGQLAGTLSAGLWLILPLLGLGLILIRFCSFRIRQLTWLIPLCFIGGLLLQLFRHLPVRLEAEQISGRTIALEGVVSTMPHPQNAYSTVIIRRSGGRRIALTGPTGKLAYGSQIRVQVLVQRPFGSRNPGGFDQSAWLRRQAVYLTAVPAEDETGHPGQIELIRPARSLSVYAWGARKRAGLHQLFLQLLPPAEAARLSAVMLGDKSQLSQGEQAMFRKAGLAHLTAVSGTHVALLLLPTERLLRRSRIGRRRRIILLLASLFAYGTLTGWPVSVSRAVVMCVSVLAGRLLVRPVDSLNSLGAAAFLLLLLRPDTVLAIGFWLSLLATASLILAAGPLTDWLQKLMPWLPAPAALALAAPVCTQAAVLPLSLAMSGELVWLGILSNIIAVPLVQLSLISAGLILPLAGLAAWLWPAALQLAIIGALPLRSFLFVLGRLAVFFACLPVPRLPQGLFSPLIWLALFLLFLRWSGFWQKAWLFCGKMPVQARRSWRQVWLICVTAVLLYTLLSWLLAPAAQVWFIDVGQGDAILLRVKNGRTVLIDGGRSGSGYRHVLPALDAIGIAKIDAAIATHGHDDHLGGLVDLLEMGRLSRVYLPVSLVKEQPAQDQSSRTSLSDWVVPPTAEASVDQLVEKVLQLAAKRSIEVQTLQRHDTIILDSRSSLNVLHPLAREQENPHEDGNERSLLILAELAQSTLLLAGDCTEDTELQLLTEQLWPAADLLKVAHHGSGRTTSGAFLESVRPQAAIICVGAGNRYGHPADRVLEQLDSVGCPVWRTDMVGAIRWRISKKGWMISAMLADR